MGTRSYLEANEKAAIFTKDVVLKGALLQPPAVLLCALLVLGLSAYFISQINLASFAFLIIRPYRLIFFTALGKVQKVL